MPYINETKLNDVKHLFWWPFSCIHAQNCFSNIPFKTNKANDYLKFGFSNALEFNGATHVNLLNDPKYLGISCFNIYRFFVVVCLFFRSL